MLGSVFTIIVAPWVDPPKSSIPLSLGAIQPVGNALWEGVMEPYVYCKHEKTGIPKRGCKRTQQRNPFPSCASCIQTRYVRIWESWMEARKLEEGPEAEKIFAAPELLLRETLTIDEPCIFERPPEYHSDVPAFRVGWLLVGNRKKWEVSYSELHALIGKISELRDYPQKMIEEFKEYVMSSVTDAEGAIKRIIVLSDTLNVCDIPGVPRVGRRLALAGKTLEWSQGLGKACSEVFSEVPDILSRKLEIPTPQARF